MADQEAFQKNAFQNDAFQVGGHTPAPPPQPVRIPRPIGAFPVLMANPPGDGGGPVPKAKGRFGPRGRPYKGYPGYRKW